MASTDARPDAEDATDDAPKVAVYGAGGVGGYVGGRLAQAGADVHLLARGDHLDALRSGGLRIESVAGDVEVSVPATDDPADVGPCDYVLVTVKSFDTAAVTEAIPPLLGDETAVVSLQNGVDNEEILADAVGADHVMGGVAYIFSTIGDPGVVEHTGGPATLTVGELDGTPSDRAARLVEWCDRAEGLSAELSESIRVDLWEKAAFICAQAGMTAAVRLPLGDVRATEESWTMYRRILEEACRVARAEGVDVPADAVERWLAMAADLDAEAYSSLHYDMTNGKRMELDALHGAVLRRARARDVDAPMTEAVYAVLRPWARRNEAGAAD